MTSVARSRKARWRAALGCLAISIVVGEAQAQSKPPQQRPVMSGPAGPARSFQGGQPIQRRIDILNLRDEAALPNGRGAGPVSHSGGGLACIAGCDGTATKLVAHVVRQPVVLALAPSEAPASRFDAAICVAGCDEVSGPPAPVALKPSLATASASPNEAIPDRTFKRAVPRRSQIARVVVTPARVAELRRAGPRRSVKISGAAIARAIQRARPIRSYNKSLAVASADVARRPSSNAAAIRPGVTARGPSALATARRVGRRPDATPAQASAATDWLANLRREQTSVH